MIKGCIILGLVTLQERVRDWGCLATIVVGLLALAAHSAIETMIQFVQSWGTTPSRR